MQSAAIEIRVNPEVMVELQKIARTKRISVSDVARMAIYRDMTKAQSKETYPDPDWPELEADLRRARNWLELRARLLQRGYVVQRDGAALVLKSARSDQRFAWPNAPDLTHSALTARFGTPMSNPKAPQKGIVASAPRERIARF